MATRMTGLGLASFAAVTLLGCSAGARVSMFDNDDHRAARVVRFEERHCYEDECVLHHEGKVISGSMDVDVRDND